MAVCTYMGLLRWLSGKEFICQCRRHGFDPWVTRKWQFTPLFLLGKSHGQRSPTCYSPWSCKRVSNDLITKQQQHMPIHG